MEKKQVTQEQMALLNKPLPREAIKPHPTKTFLSTINSIYVTERLNEVFGVGAWSIQEDHVTTKTTTYKSRDGREIEKNMIVVKVCLDIPEYGIHYECYGGNDNEDMGDAYKGATTDAITKIASWMGIGSHVWKNDPNGLATSNPQKASKAKAQKEDNVTVKTILTLEQMAMVNAFNETGKYEESFDKTIDTFTSIQQLKEFKLLIADKHKNGSKLCDVAMAKKLTEKYNTLNK